MSILLYCVGAIAVVAGLVMAGFGVPVSEFSFGNTLIVAGATLVSGGLIVFGLGAVVSQLRQLLDMGALPHGAQLQRTPESFEGGAPQLPAGRVLFPPRPKAAVSEPLAASPEPADKPADIAAVVAAPTLPNPDEAPETIAETVPLSPPQPADEVTDRTIPKEPTPQSEAESAFEREWPAPEPARERRTFGFKWPERKQEPPVAAVAPEPQPLPEPQPEPLSEPEPEPQPEAAPAQAAERPRDVAILKSGVVDGMGYTLYVDGSIEAELPQGTLRFASINELREHLEQNT